MNCYFTKNHMSSKVGGKVIKHSVRNKCRYQGRSQDFSKGGG